MVCIVDSKKLKNMKKNKFIGSIPKLIDSFIEFKGENNVFICEEDVILENSKIIFNCDNSIVYLSSNKHNYKININVYNNNVCFFGINNYFNDVVNVILSESKNVVVGNGCLFSIGNWLRVADPHLIYNADTMRRINFSKSIYIGDHVWVGQNVMLLKGTKIGSGSILAAGAVVSGKKVNSNCVVGGNPVKIIKEDIFWDGECVHSWTKEKTKKSIDYTSDKYIYYYNKEYLLQFEDIEKRLCSFTDINEKVEYIKNNLVGNDKNRFYIGKRFVFKKRYVKKGLKKLYSLLRKKFVVNVK